MCKATLKPLLPLLLTILPVVLGVQECYVCVPGEGAPELERQFPQEELPVCGRGQGVAKQCPRQFKGCLTKYDGDKITRGCGEISMTVCRNANGVTYCYCGGHLCNVEGAEAAAVQSAKNEPPPDDEDLSREGSGSGGGGGSGSGGGGRGAATAELPPPTTTPLPGVTVAPRNATAASAAAPTAPCLALGVIALSVLLR